MVKATESASYRSVISNQFIYETYPILLIGTVTMSKRGIPMMVLQWAGIGFVTIGGAMAWQFSFQESDDSKHKMLEERFYSDDKERMSRDKRRADMEVFFKKFEKSVKAGGKGGEINEQFDKVLNSGKENLQIRMHDTKDKE